MLQRLAFQWKVMLLPMAAAVAFVIIIVANTAIGVRNTGYLDELQTTLSPALQMAINAEAGLADIQRGLQDAAAAKDRERFDAAEAAHLKLLGTLQDAERNPELADIAPRVRDLVERYWDSASRVTLQIVDSVAGDLDTHEIETMQSRFAAAQAELAKQTTRVRTAMDERFTASRATSSLSSRVNLLTAAVCLAALFFLSRWIRVAVIGTLSDVTNFVSAASAEILAVAKQTEVNAKDEAAFITETQRSMDGLVQASSEIQESAGRVLGQAEQSESASRAVSERILKLDSQAQKISDISEVIRSIADKTDMLALNAALEGSKAGEAGRGISLVGAEMRRLAETVTGAVRQIKELATEIRDLSRSTVTATEVGQKLARETSEASKEISLLIDQQRSVTSQVTQSIVEIQQFAQQAKAGAEQARSTAADLVRSTTQLELLVSGDAAKRMPEKTVAVS
jgi:hypothetical protein